MSTAADGEGSFVDSELDTVPNRERSSSAPPETAAAVAPAAASPIARCHACGVPTAIATALAQLEAERVGAAGTTSAAAAGLPHVLFDVPAPDAPLQAKSGKWKRQVEKAVIHAKFFNVFAHIQIGGI